MAFPGLEEVSEVLYLDEHLPYTAYPYQKRGYLMAVNSKFAPMKLCVVKDGFFLWYSAEAAADTFDTKPQGLVPLHDCIIYITTENSSTFGISNTSMIGVDLKFQASDPTKAMKWKEACENAKKASITNGALGHALIEQLQNRDKRKDEELQAAVDQMKKKALETQKAYEKKAKILKKQEEQRRRHDRDMQQALADKAALEKKKKKTQAKLQNLNREEREVQKNKIKMETTLEEVKATLRRLELTLLASEDERDNPDEEDRAEIGKSITILREFFAKSGTGYVKPPPGF